MFYLFYKFFKESILLADYIISYYLSNIIMITFFQSLILILIFLKIKIKIKELGKEIFLQKNPNLIKNILISYYQEQINFITKLFNNKIIQQLIPDIVSNKTNKNNKNNVDTSIENHNKKDRLLKLPAD